MYKNLKNFCNMLLKVGIPGFDLSVYKDGKSVIRYMNGYSNIEKKIKMQGNEKYYIYSCSKLITCTAALQLYEKGLFSLDDKLSDYMPEFKDMYLQTKSGLKKAENPILIKHLFEMTAGFSYNLFSDNIKQCQKDTNGKCPTRELMKYLAKDPLLFEPGERYEYSLCHDVLAALVEIISGTPFNDYVTENIFKPLGMKDTTYLLPEDQKDEITTLYRFDTVKGYAFDCGKNHVYRLGSEYASGGAGCVSTVDDYMKFLEGLRTYKLLKPETVELMATDRLNEEQRKSYDTTSGNHYGYGLGVRCPDSTGLCTDFGWDGAAGAYLAVDIKNGLSVYLGMHLLSSPAQQIRSRVFNVICAEILGIGDINDIYKELEALGVSELTY